MTEAAETLANAVTELRQFANAGVYNELFDEAGGVRPHQARLLSFIEGAGQAQLGRLRQQIQHRINEHEVTFNILGIPEGTSRPWRLDTLPLVVDAAEWAKLGEALAQRARALSLLHADLIGSQVLLRERVIPPELVLGHPSYFRACHGWVPLGGHRLHLYAADLGRGPDGRFRVYSDRVAAPAGAGFALENRLVIGRTLPALFNDYGVETTRRFFETVQRSLEELAPSYVDEPRVVLLSTGAHDESAFEHAYLARYLGYELVEGRDLTVRDRIVYLKTLSGLRRVDVIMRRIKDAWCDPLSLREDSTMGVPGLVEAAAVGNVAVANPLGVAIVESPALRPFLQQACRHLLGEDLLLDSVETWWCGQAEALQHVLSRLDEYVIKPAFEDRKGEPLQPRLMESEAKAALVDRIKANPAQYVAERWSELSVAPVLEHDEVHYGHVAIRGFLCRDGEDYQMLPGGLARVNSGPDGLFLSLNTTSASKDIWVPSPPQIWSRAPAFTPERRVELRRGGLDLPSRLLDDIYWLGRYVERADMTARLLRAAFECLGSEAGIESRAALAAVAAAMRKLELIPALRPQASPADVAALLTAALIDGLPASLRSVCAMIHRLTLRVRSRLSRDAWHVLKRLNLLFSDYMAGENGHGTAIELVNDVLITLAAVNGTTLENMVRGHAWLFLDMGRRVERGVLTLSVVDAMLHAGAARANMEVLLEVTDSLLTYRARYLSSLQAAPVVDLVLTDGTNPRSLSFQVDGLREHIERLPRLDDVVRSRAERRIIELQANLLTADIAQACAGNGDGLRELLQDASTLLWQFSDDVTRTWFSHATTSRALAPPQWINEELEVP